jgi:polyphosphate kinase 2 (PPK2 family)
VEAPWYVVPADRKWFRNLAIADILADTLADLDPQYPERPDLPADLVIE